MPWPRTHDTLARGEWLEAVSLEDGDTSSDETSFVTQTTPMPVIMADSPVVSEFETEPRLHAISRAMAFMARGGQPVRLRSWLVAFMAHWRSCLRSVIVVHPRRCNKCKEATKNRRGDGLDEPQWPKLES